MMKSKISIEIDYENGNQPIIQILSKNSDDIRDGLIKSFYQKLQGSCWCRIVFKQDVDDNSVISGEGFKRIFITPIPETELKKEAEIMLEQARVREKYEQQEVEGL